MNHMNKQQVKNQITNFKKYLCQIIKIYKQKKEESQIKILNKIKLSRKMRVILKLIK